MTVQKSFKRLVRARMAKTGESYTAARAQLLAGVDGRKPADEDIPQLACSDKRIRERTGRGWEEWFDLLDSWGAGSMAHSEVVHRVAEVLGALMEGKSADAIAAESVVSVATIRTQIRSILSKLGVNSQLAAVARAQEARWEPPEPR